MDTLNKIIDYKRQELEHISRKLSKKDVELMAADMDPAMPFLQNFMTEDINIIAEVKKASPSAGIIRENFHPVDIAKIYQDHGAKALSVLTDENFFKGHINFLKEIRANVSLPLLRKDFTLGEYHIFQGRAYGADAILLIVAALDDHQLKDFHDLTIELGMTPLVEVHDEIELNRALKLDLRLLGINNRNLKTFKTDVETTLTLKGKIQQDTPIISESGLKNHDILLKLKESGIAGFLIGETLMRAEDIGMKLEELQGS